MVRRSIQAGPKETGQGVRQSGSAGLHHIPAVAAPQASGQTARPRTVVSVLSVHQGTGAMAGNQLDTRRAADSHRGRQAGRNRHRHSRSPATPVRRAPGGREAKGGVQAAVHGQPDGEDHRRAVQGLRGQGAEPVGQRGAGEIIAGHSRQK